VRKRRRHPDRRDASNVDERNATEEGVLMPVAEKEHDGLTSGGRGAALKTAAAAAATGAATIAVRKALSHDGGSKGEHRSESGSGKGSQGMLSSVLSSGWEAAADVVIPIAEDAAGAAGKYVAQHGPEVVRERIVPKFIEAFESAK
jgi:hypothetical protein